MLREIKKGTEPWDKLFLHRDVTHLSQNDSIRLKDDESSSMFMMLMNPQVKRIAIIGARDIDQYNRQTIKEVLGTIKDSYSENGPLPVIISGFGIGTDTIAHITALELDLPTIAVLPSGFDNIYPKNNIVLAEKLLKIKGCGLLSQFPEQTEPTATNFSERIKTIVMMSDEVIVPATKEKGSAYLGATYAYTHNVPVYAIPGRIHDVNSRGCLKLIQEKKADIYLDF